MPTRKNTRAAQGSGTIRQRKDGRWEARYTVGRDPGTGKQVQRSIYGDTQKEVRQKLRDITTEIDDGSYSTPSKMTLGAWLDVWLAEYTSNLKPRTHALYRGHIEYRVKPALGAMKLSAIKPHDIQTFYNQLQKETKDKPPLSPKSIKNIHGVLHKMFSQAMEIGYIKTNPSDVCKLPKIIKAEIKPLDDGQITLFLQAIQGHTYENLYVVDLFTGLRQGEILGLTWDCVDFKTGIITIYRQLQRIDGTYKHASLKNDKSRRITVAPAIVELLHEHRRRQYEMRLKAGSAWENSNLVFTNEFGGHLVRETVYRNFKRIVKRLGISDARFHDLRHSYAVASLQSGDDIKTVQENLGHHTAAFTLDVYGHATERMKAESAARMDGYFRRVKNGI